jgi:hypothetical protein
MTSDECNIYALKCARRFKHVFVIKPTRNTKENKHV